MNKAHWCWLIPLVLVLLFCGVSPVMMNIDSAYEKHRTIYNSHIMREFISSEVARAGYSEKLDAAAGEEDYVQRIADNIYYVESELHMSLGQFRAQVARYLGEKRLRLRPEELKVHVD